MPVILPTYVTEPVTEWQKRVFAALRKTGHRAEVTAAGPESMQVAIRYFGQLPFQFLGGLAKARISIGIHVENASTILVTFTKV